ncbi:hypothetical protein [Roseicella aquatilis]|uniref:Lipoprotein n=1 Tax=Roseicella aquatilis TaxID=2527868 RepID=A0A4R4DLU5_9PROT|nr:hypothetical protein [Roseicella aquatilis]TCZ61043.1 hypothetical protein EXY23_12935 [Roseicella aquatilis]
MRMRRAAFPAVLVLLAAGCAPVVPYHPPPHAGHPPTTDRGDGHGSTMPSTGLTRAGGMYPGAAADGAREHQRHGLDPDAGSQYGGAGYGTGAYGPIR